MDRDIKLIKMILEATKNKASEETWIEIDFPNYEAATIIGHIRLLDDEGYIEAVDLSCIGHTDWRPQRLTNSGHDYLDRLNTPLYRTIISQIVNTSGKIIWIFVGGLVGSIGTYVATLLIGSCK